MSTALGIAVLVAEIVAIIVFYFVGRLHGWMSAQAAFQEQREPLPPLSRTDR